MSDLEGAIDRTVDVAVVGAGMAGIKAALELEARGMSVCLLEARDRVGGRLKPGHIAGHTIDKGGQWVGPQQKLLLAEARAQGVETYDQFTTGKSEQHYKGAVKTSTSELPKMPLVSLLELQRVVSKLDRLAYTLPADAPMCGRRRRANFCGSSRARCFAVNPSMCRFSISSITSAAARALTC